MLWIFSYKNKMTFIQNDILFKKNGDGVARPLTKVRQRSYESPQMMQDKVEVGILLDIIAGKSVVIFQITFPDQHLPVRALTNICCLSGMSSKSTSYHTKFRIVFFIVEKAYMATSS